MDYLVFHNSDCTKSDITVNTTKAKKNSDSSDVYLFSEVY